MGIARKQQGDVEKPSLSFNLYLISGYHTVDSRARSNDAGNGAEVLESNPERRVAVHKIDRPNKAGISGNRELQYLAKR